MSTQDNDLVTRSPIDAYVTEWIEAKRTRTGSARTKEGYQDTMHSFREALAVRGLDLLATNAQGPDDLLTHAFEVARVAGIWAGLRNGNTRRAGEQVAASTFNLRLAIVSSWYTFMQETYKLDIPNPIKDVKRRPVNEYERVEPLEAESVEQGLAAIDRSNIEGLRDYALLSVALATGRRASELAGLRGQDVKLQGRGAQLRIRLTFHCKGNKIMRDLLDEDVSAVLLDYLQAEYKRKVSQLDPDAPLWISHSRNGTRGQAIGTRTLSNICLSRMGTGKTHVLRHTFADGMVEEKAPITELQARLGHTDLKITQRYVEKLRSDENPYSRKITAHYGIRRRAGK